MVRSVLAIICAFFSAWVAMVLVGLIAVDVLIDGSTQAGRDARYDTFAALLAALSLTLAIGYYRSQSVRRIFGWTFLSVGLIWASWPIVLALGSEALANRNDPALADAVPFTAGGSVIVYIVATVLCAIAVAILRRKRQAG